MVGLSFRKVMPRQRYRAVDVTEQIEAMLIAWCPCAEHTATRVLRRAAARADAEGVSVPEAQSESTESRTAEGYVFGIDVAGAAPTDGTVVIGHVNEGGVIEFVKDPSVALLDLETIQSFFQGAPRPHRPSGCGDDPSDRTTRGSKAANGPVQGEDVGNGWTAAELVPLCACGQDGEWRYNLTQSRGWRKSDDDSGDRFEWYCQDHGPNTPPTKTIERVEADRLQGNCSCSSLEEAHLAGHDECFARIAGAFTPDEADDAGVPSPDEVDAVMRAGLCDSTELVGTPVVYQTDERGGKSYHLPAVVTVVQLSHADLPQLRGAEEAERVVRRHDRDYGLEHPFGDVVRNPDGYWIPKNPVPIPLDGTVHLKVTTPGPQDHYNEWSVPYDPTGKPRTWRFLDGHAPL